VHAASEGQTKRAPPIPPCNQRYVSQDATVSRQICSLFLLLYRVLELQNRKVQLHGCLCIARLQVVIKNSGDLLTAFASLHEGLLISFIFNLGEIGAPNPSESTPGKTLKSKT
jgi:hypothetical protein